MCAWMDESEWMWMKVNESGKATRRLQNEGRRRNWQFCAVLRFVWPTDRPTDGGTDMTVMTSDSCARLHIDIK